MRVTKISIDEKPGSHMRAEGDGAYRYKGSRNFEPGPVKGKDAAKGSAANTSAIEKDAAKDPAEVNRQRQADLDKNIDAAIQFAVSAPEAPARPVEEKAPAKPAAKSRSDGGPESISFKSSVGQIESEPVSPEDAAIDRSMARFVEEKAPAKERFVEEKAPAKAGASPEAFQEDLVQRAEAYLRSMGASDEDIARTKAGLLGALGSTLLAPVSTPGSRFVAGLSSGQVLGSLASDAIRENLGTDEWVKQLGDLLSQE